MKVLIIEDDANIVSLLKRGFMENNYLVESADNGKDGEYLAALNSYDVIIIDWMLPFMSGVEVIRSLRHKKITTPIIVLSAKGEVEDKVLALRWGADDYLSKPFAYQELLARVDGLYRRELCGSSNTMEFNNFSVDFDTKEVLKDQQLLQLRPKEYDLLLLLIKYKNSVVSSEMIEEHLYGMDERLQSNTVSVTVYNLRKKLGKEMIKSYRGMGYKLEI